MADVASLKAEIKGWERDFKAKNGREPQVQDIKDVPAIAAKYKLYKKLGKAAASSSAKASSSTAPSTPPKQANARLLPKARATVEPTAPLTTFNPFSPQKSRTVRQQSPAALNAIATNPFATPSRPKGKARSFTQELSPAPFPIANGDRVPQVLFSSTPTANVPSAVSRARKRLRGDAVSPSPAKEKRRRIESEEPPPSPTTNETNMDDDDVFTDAGNSSFVDDSPVKGSSFKLLFDESASLSKPLFPPRASSQRLSPSLEESARDDDKRTRVKSERLFPSIFPTSRPVRDLPNKRAVSRQQSADREVIAPGGSRKRVLSFSEPGPSEQPTRHVPLLVPPSPPPPETSKRLTGPFKGKGKAAKNDRKKAKLAASESDEDDDIKVVVRSKTRSPRAAHNSDGDGDDMFPLLSKRPNGDLGPSPVDADLFEVDLPDKLRQVLAFSPADSKEELHKGRLIEGLLYGRRTEHYDASKGGEIWDVGEQDGDEVEEEDDWEGEAVPWEVGEL